MFGVHPSKGLPTRKVNNILKYFQKVIRRIIDGWGGMLLVSLPKLSSISTSYSPLSSSSSFLVYFLLVLHIKFTGPALRSTKSRLLKNY